MKPGRDFSYTILEKGRMWVIILIDEVVFVHIWVDEIHPVTHPPLFFAASHHTTLVGFCEMMVVMLTP